MAHLLVFGTSIDHGYYDTEGGWVERLKNYLYKKVVASNRELDYAVYNLGISGDTTEGMLQRFDLEARMRLSEQEENIVIFSVGVNDSQIINSPEGGSKVPIETFEANLRNLIKKARKVASEIVFIGLTPADESRVKPIPWAPEFSYINESIDQYDKIIESLCKSEKLLFIDLNSKFKKINYEELLEDGIHPNTKGHSVIYGVVKKALEDEKLIMKFPK